VGHTPWYYLLCGFCISGRNDGITTIPHGRWPGWGFRVAATKLEYRIWRLSNSALCGNARSPNTTDRGILPISLYERNLDFLHRLFLPLHGGFCSGYDETTTD